MKNKKMLLFGVAFGALVGFLYWNFIGCTTGTCAITSSPINSTIYGSLMGGLLFSSWKKNNNNKKEEL